MPPATTEPIDVVYTWVDGAWPGYDALLRQRAATVHDVNPNRYRDNVDILKYSLRSLDRYVPWIRHVYLATCRPQVPEWLDPDRVRIVHHDAFIPAGHLPTFNSFAIVANLHRMAGVSERFIYMVDDVVFGRPVAPADLYAADGRILVYRALKRTPAADARLDARTSPWNHALRQSNARLDERYGAAARHEIRHAPQPIDRASWQAMIDLWPDAFDQTSASPFRAPENIAPEYLYPYFLLGEGLAEAVPFGATYRRTAYHPFNNVALFQWMDLWRVRAERPCFCGLNDNFGARPSSRAVALVRRALESWFPEPSRFERAR
jgi:Stealth protein CR2, conserved region 2/Stealth protein CR3, conserved region 3/Stealth protein CR4, conserved region 4